MEWVNARMQTTLWKYVERCEGVKYVQINKFFISPFYLNTHTETHSVETTTIIDLTVFIVHYFFDCNALFAFVSRIHSPFSCTKHLQPFQYNRCVCVYFKNPLLFLDIWWQSASLRKWIISVCFFLNIVIEFTNKN